jgi:hypothetical protein
MKRSMLACAFLLLATPALAEEKDPKAAGGGGPDMTKMGPWTRKPTNEKQTKKEVTEFLKVEEELAKKGDFDGAVARVDFPVYMLTDDAKGTPESDSWDKERYTATMKPFWEHMPKDTKVAHKLVLTVLSDSLVNVTDDFTMTMGKQKLSGRNMAVVVKRDGQWKWKVMGEAGWGGMNNMAPPAHAEATPKK